MRLVYITLFALIFCGCQTKNNKVIRVGILDGPSAVSFASIITEAKMIEGYKVEFIIKDEPIQIQAMMMQNELDFAVLPTVMAANLYNKGIQYQMAACPVWGTLYIVGKKTNANKISQLEGQNIYTFGQGATADILLQHQISKYKLKDIKIKYDYKSNNELVQAIENEKIKFAVISEPMVSTLKNLDPEIQTISPIQCEDTINGVKMNIFAQTALMVQKDFNKKHPTLANKFLISYQSECYNIQHPNEKTLEWLVEAGYYSNFNLAIESIEKCHIHFRYADEVKTELKRYLQIFYNFDPKSIGGSLPDGNFILTH